MKEIETHGAKAVAIRADLRDTNFGQNVVKATLAGLGTKELDILGELENSFGHSGFGNRQVLWQD